MSDTPAEVCANCGKEASDAVKLKNCTACRLVKYCGVDCQKIHRKQHKTACKKRAAEIKDEQLYTQGQERPEEDFCPLCTLPIHLPMDNHSSFSVCCMKRVCHGCEVASIKINFGGMKDCPFCRTPTMLDDVSHVALMQTRVDAKDPVAMDFLANKYSFGGCGLELNIPRAIKLWKEAAELGSTDANFNLGNQYSAGKGVMQNKAKAVQYWEKAAMKGHAEARCNLGINEYNRGNYERALRHFMISVKMGDINSSREINNMYKKGRATKVQYAEALKGCQDAMEEMKSPDRDEAKAIFESHASLMK